MHVNPGQYGPIDTNTCSSNTVLAVQPNTVQIQSITVPIQSNYYGTVFEWTVLGCIATVLRLYWDCIATVRIGLHWPGLTCIGTALAYIYLMYRYCIALGM